MVWPFSKREPEGPAPIAVAPLTDPTARKGMWVNASGRIGIITNFINGDIEVTYTKSDGSTVMVMNDAEVVVPACALYPAQQVRRAVIGEIPTSRYESVELLKALGYGD